ncbi:putative 3',5'-cyclic-nucleotide phosphodiesterase [Methylophaga aminisulfidivorans MP]|uniref:Putative 3',5'-cyclic-nucleotide phosphodiesterase n=1 Tax=Methylophaga aminisulfidivorans MP TaxID=1026882 RepID=F5T2S8_9GAMM|nr:metallophosphoesterase [Methylophaga aminisulfidivorans]EGL53289.1 putative 3',5'-cyclic-nucleotide phosphodiesterase [Methylophaga aminisulfidivorans MP]
MTTLLHISDLHFGRILTDVLEGLKRSIRVLAPEMIIISGDLTQRATAKEYQQAAEFLSSLNTPYFIVPGNHDLSTFRVVERFICPWRNWKKWIQSDLEPQFSTEDYQLMGINTARKAGFYMDWSRGRISPSQIQQITQQMSHAPQQQLQLLVAHHPFWLPPQYEARHLIGGRDEALASFKGRGLDLILSGHVHIDYCHVLDGMIISHAGTTTSDRLLPDTPNSFNVIQGDKNRLTITRHHWQQGEFQLSQSQTFQRKNGQWHEA